MAFWKTREKKRIYEADANRLYSQFYMFTAFPSATSQDWIRINYSQPIYLTNLIIRAPTAGLLFDASWMQGGTPPSNQVTFPIESFQRSPTAPGIVANINFNGGSDPNTLVNAAVLIANTMYHWHQPMRTDWIKFGVLAGTFCQFQVWYLLNYEGS